MMRVNINRVKRIKIILDWDNTIIPTSYYHKKDQSPEELKRIF